MNPGLRLRTGVKIFSPSQLKYLLKVVALGEDGHSVGNTVEARSPPRQCVRSLLCPVPETLFDKCTLGCFINYTLQKKKMQHQYASLTGVYKPDMKECFSKTSLEGLATWSKKATQGSLFVTKTYFLVGPDLCQVNF